MTAFWNNEIAVARMLRWCASLALLLGAVAVQAANVPGLYDVVVPPSNKPGDSSFAEALRQVAVRVSGSRDAGEKLWATKPNANRYVTKFSFQPDGAAAVGFDAASFDRLLTSANLPIWGRERPLVAVWLALPDAAGRVSWLGANDRSPERELVQKVALARGLPLAWPAMDASDLAVAQAMNTGARSFSQLLTASDRYRADAVLFGVGARDASGALTVRWSFAFNDEVADVQATLEDGVHFSADRCARVLAIAPGARAEVSVQVVGIRDLDAYARALNYLENVTLVTAGGVAVEQLRGEELNVRLTVRGDANALRRTIGLGRRFVEVKSDDTAERLVYRLAGNP